MSSRLSQDPFIFEIDGITFALQLQQTLFTTEIELWEFNKAVDEWYYVFDETGKRKAIFMGASPGVSASSPMPDGTYDTVDFDTMVERWGGAKAFTRDFILVEANKRLARRFPEGEKEPTVPAEVEGSMYDRCVAILNSEVQVSGKLLVMKS